MILVFIPILCKKTDIIYQFILIPLFLIFKTVIYEENFYSYRSCVHGTHS